MSVWVRYVETNEPFSSRHLKWTEKNYQLKKLIHGHHVFLIVQYNYSQDV